jgi:hypothetical protein
MQTYDQMPGLEKMCLVFIYNSNDLFIWCGYGCGKKKIKKKQNVICHVWLWQKTMTLQCKRLENKYGGNEPFKGGFNR